MAMAEGEKSYASQSFLQSHSPTSRTSQRPKKCSPSTFFLFSIILLAGTYIAFIDFSILSSPTGLKAIFTSQGSINNKIEHTLSCPNEGIKNQTCPTTSFPSTFQPDNLSTQTCPEFFRWIHEDLKPWKSRGISKEMVEKAKEYAYFRLTIVKGRVYVVKYKECYETRDVFTVWGILQLLRLYPGKLPDLDMMILACEDRPVIQTRNLQGTNSGSSPLPPPLFHYCKSNETMEIVFPDWTFWGWGELNIRPWKNLNEDIKEGNKKIKWKDREPYAYWKGNQHVRLQRYFFMKSCNSSSRTKMYQQDWKAEAKAGFKNSKLQDQCRHRYKIYIEGWAWSVSEKYILACDSMVLLVKPEFYDFFSRSLVPLQHYWHIRSTYSCRDVEFAVEWGNNHIDKAQAIGEAGSRFVQQNVKMEYVYDYMLHLLTRYAKLLKYKPEVPKGAVEVCPETMACYHKGVWRKFMEESMVKSPSDSLPCTMPAPYDPHELEAFLSKKERISRQMEMWADDYWKKASN